MRITKLEAWPISFKLATPYTIAYERVESITNIFLRIETNTNIIGYGCAAPDEKITQETSDGVLKTLREIVAPILIGSDPLRITLQLEKLKKYLKHQSSALAAVDIALYDILGKKANLPLWKLLGGFRDRIKTSVTIGIMSVDDSITMANEWIKKGFKCLKIKGGFDLEDDIERVLKLRESVGKDIELRFDANQGYTETEAVEFVKQAKRAHLSLIEQPTPKENLVSLGVVTRDASIPVMADESLMNLQDAFRLAKRDLVNMVNIKLMKVGGISEALQIDSVARAGALEVMVGCMDEAGLAIAAGLHFALSRPNILYADLDGHLDLLNDPSHDAVIIKNGVLFPRKNPGFGIDL